MTDTFIVYEVTPRTTMRYEIPDALKWAFDAWKPPAHTLTIYRPAIKMTVARLVDYLHVMFPEIADRIKVATKPPVLLPRGFAGTVTHFDHPI